MNNDEAKIFAAQIGAEIPELDLHGYFPVEALEKLEAFIYSSCKIKATIIRVIYGLGTGRLRQEIVNYLEVHPLIDKIVEESGSALVLLK